MVYIAQFKAPQGRQRADITVLDDRGVPATEVDLPEAVTEPAQADGHLGEAGWSRTADWTETARGWEAPVEPSNREEPTG